MAMASAIPREIGEKVNRVGRSEYRGGDAYDDQRTPASFQNRGNQNAERRCEKSTKVHVAGGGRDQRRNYEPIFDKEINRPWDRNEEPSRRNPYIERTCGRCAAREQRDREHRGDIAAEPAREIQHGEHRRGPLREAENRVGENE